jgi:heat shock protein HtpX
MTTMRTFLLMLALTLLILFICIGVWGNAGANIGIGIAVVTNLLSYWFADKAVIAMTGARELRPGEFPQLTPIVQRLATAAGLPMPKLYVLETAEPNAFATGRDPEHSAVAVTSGIMNTLTEAELTGVIAHELAHIKHRDILISAIAATMAGIISQFAYVLRFGGMGSSRNNSRSNPLAIIAIVLVAPLAATLIRLGISREREFAADEGGAQFSQNPLALADALAKIEQVSSQSALNVNPSTASLFIVNPFTSQRIMSLFSTHPPTSERIERLRAIAKQMHP